MEVQVKPVTDAWKAADEGTFTALSFFVSLCTLKTFAFALMSVVHIVVMVGYWKIEEATIL